MPGTAFLMLATLLLGADFFQPLWAGERTYAALARIGWSVRPAYRMLHDMLGEVPDMDLSHINFGENYDPSKLNIVIVETRQFEAMSIVNVGSFRIRFEQLYLNGAALDQDIVALDSDWLSVILLCVENRQEASSDHPHPNKASQGQDPGQLVIFRQVVDDARRGEILHEFINRLPSRVALRRTAVALLSDLEEMRSRDPSRYRRTIRICALAFLPMLLHEFAHHSGSINVLGARFANPVQDAINAARDWLDAYVTRREEDRADNVTVAKLTPLMQAIKTHAASPRTTKEELGLGVRQIISLEAYALIQRDMVLLRVFPEFRGYQFPDVYYRIFHQPCNVDAKQPEQIGFYDYDKVAFAFNEPIPMLTRREYEQARAGLDPPALQTHAHAFQRAARLLKIAQLNGTDASMDEIEQFESFLTNIRDGSPRIRFHFEYRVGKMNYTLSEFFKRLGKTGYGRRYSIERAVICPFDECYVAMQPAVRGLPQREYFEIAAVKGVIVKIKYVSPIVKPDSRQGQSPERQNAGAGSPPDLYLKQMANMILATDLLFPDGTLTIKSFAESLGMLRMYRLKCGNGMTHHELKDRTVLGRTTFTGDAIELSAEGAIPN